jgi:hypothetical protein
MVKLEKLLKIGARVAVVLPLMLLSKKLAMDEIPNKIRYIPHQITIEEKLSTSQGLREEIYANEKVLAVARKLIGTDVPKGEDICCWTAVKYIYDKSNVLMNCIYAVNGGEKFNFKNETTRGKYESLIVGVTKKNNSLIIPAIPISKCLLNSKNTDYKKKIDSIERGDILSYVFSGESGHNAIFMDWKDKEKRIAELFDWGRGTKKFRTYEENLNEDSHPVYIYWRPFFRKSILQ